MTDYIVSNSATCNNCGEAIFSAHRHDFRSCKCGNVSVDGGQEYIRRLFKDREGYKDTSIVMDKNNYLFTVQTLEDLRGITVGDNETELMMCVLRSLFNTGSLTVDTWRDVEGMLLTYHGESVKSAVSWALENNRNTNGIVNAIVRKVNEVGFLKQ